MELKLKVAGPSEVRYNEPAQFRCESNREDIEFTMALDQQNIKTAFTSAEYLLSAGQLEYGTNQFVLECFALDENNDKETISHTVNVLCKYKNILFFTIHISNIWKTFFLTKYGFILDNLLTW